MTFDNNDVGINLSHFKTEEELIDVVGVDRIKAELERLRLKCGGRPLERARRLWMTKDIPVNELPSKFFSKEKSLSIRIPPIVSTQKVKKLC